MDDDLNLQEHTMLKEPWQSRTARVIAGHGVASGRTCNSPYPEGSIKMQAPFFQQAGVDLTECFFGTVNLSVAPQAFDFYNPQVTLWNVSWSDQIQPEHFSFSPCRIRLLGQPNNKAVQGWIYYPRPETKTVHFQPAHTIEVIAPKIQGLVPGDEVQFEYLASQVRFNTTESDAGTSARSSSSSLLSQCLALCLLLLVIPLSGCTVSEIIGSNLQKNPEKRVEVGLQAATEYLKADDVENALRHINKVLELDSKNAEAHQTMALIYTRENKLALAESYYKKAIRYDKTLSSARNNYATLLYSMGRYDEAIEQLLVATNDLEYDNRAQAVQNLGLSYMKQGRMSDAEASFQTAIRLNPKLSRSLLELSDLLLAQKQYKLAARYLRDYAATARHTPRSLWIGIQIERVNGNQDAIASYALSLRNIYPNSVEYRRYMETKANDR